MLNDRSRIGDAEKKLQQAIQPAGPWLEGLARAGYAARGIVYILIGALAVLAARPHGGRTGGTEGALRFLAGHRFGWVIIILLALGMAAFAVWSFARGLLDPEQRGRDLRGLARRFANVFTGFVYCGLALGMTRFLLQMAQLAAPAHAQFDEHAAREWTATLMSFPLGRFAVAGVGVGMIVFAIFQVPSAIHASSADPVRVGPTARGWIRWLGRIGIISQGIVFVPVGIFLITAAWYTNPQKARGLGGALAALRSEPEGQWLLAVVAMGLVAYGFYQLVLARYRSIRT
jgi:hypothetical protein